MMERAWPTALELGTAARASRFGNTFNQLIDADIVIIPFNVGVAGGKFKGGNHWMLCVADLRRGSEKLIFYDSCRSSGKSPYSRIESTPAGALRVFGEYLGHLYTAAGRNYTTPTQWPTHFPACPQQNNGCDCGVFTMLFADYIARRARMDWVQSDIPAARDAILRQLVAMAASGR